MAGIPFGATLSTTKDIIGGILKKKAISRIIVRLEWEGVTISDDADMEAVKDRHTVAVLLQ